MTDWRGLLDRLKAGEGLAGRIWEKLDAGRRRQAEKWLAGSAPEDEGLKAPNYYTPDVRDAVVRVLNDLLADKALTAHAADLSPGALACFSSIRYAGLHCHPPTKPSRTAPRKRPFQYPKSSSTEPGATPRIVVHR